MVSTISKERLAALNCVLGLDCSKYQADITWSKAKAAGIDFAFVKITEGTTGHEDSIYNVRNRVLEAQKNNVKISYYHFCRPGDINNPEDDANAEITNIINHYNILPKPNFPLVLDVEAYANNIIWSDTEKIDHMNKFITAFISGLKQRNISVIIYSYRSFINTNTNHSFGSNPLWEAAYLDDPENYQPAVPQGWSEWKIWQFTEKGLIDGYVGDIDLNIMKKDFFNKF
jgi:lysozyme